jgi:hypothetical protein
MAYLDDGGAVVSPWVRAIVAHECILWHPSMLKKPTSYDSFTVDSFQMCCARVIQSFEAYLNTKSFSRSILSPKFYFRVFLLDE